MNLKHKEKYSLNETESTLRKDILMSTLFHCLKLLIENEY